MKLRLGVLALAVALLAGCKTENMPPGIGGGNGVPGQPGVCVDHDGDGFGMGCALGNDCDDGNAAVTNQCYVCAHDEPGCPCATEGARAACGKVTARIGDQTTCGSGATFCANGKWGECILDGTSTRSFHSTRASLGLAPPTACTANPCDPYCKQYPDTPDKSLSTPGGIVGTDGGLTLERVDSGVIILPNGPMPDGIKTTLIDAGLYPDVAPDAIIYHELVPPATAEDTITANTNVGALDVYFLDYTTGRNAPNVATVRTSLGAANGVIDQVRSAVPDSWFGVGRYEQFSQDPWRESGLVTVPYQHVRSMTSDLTQVRDSLTWVGGKFVAAGWPWPASWTAALFAEATTDGLLASGNVFWVLPRSSWVGQQSGESGPCPPGRLGYPCFRASALPITVLLAESPTNNGPGGQYAYARNAAYNIQGAKMWTAPPIPVAGNWSEAEAFSLDPITQFATYSGTNVGAPADREWDSRWLDDCAPSMGRVSPNVYFKFRVTQRTWYHFDTFGSNFSTLLYLYDPGALSKLACIVGPVFPTTPSPLPSSLDGWVNPGTYYLILDGTGATPGNYVLHVNAMPDGAATGPVAAPNFDEAMTAYNALGGKVVTVDSSGFNCIGGTSVYDLHNTHSALEKVLIDTGSPSSNDLWIQPFSTNPCRPNEGPADQRIADAIVGTFNSVANVPMDLTAAAFDTDDAVDFDGPPGGSNILTPVNIDDATFVTSIVTVATPETTANCQQTLPTRFVGCQPGTKVTFNVTFQTPATVPVLTNDQIFTFAIRTLRNGTLAVGETPVVIVVPATSSYADAWFTRDYDTTTACAKGTAPRWGFFVWDTRTPGDSRIDFQVMFAPSVAELSSAPSDALLFTDPPGPSSLAGQPIGAQDPVGGLSTQDGKTVVDGTLETNGRPRDSRVMRLRAHLVPSSDRRQSPLLRLWNQEISCQPAE